MDDAKEFLASILKTMRERLGNPLLSAFAIAWAIWNFRVILVLVGDGDGGWLAKIDYLDKQLMVPSWMWAIHGLAIPLFIAGIWIFALPLVLRKVAVFHERQLNKTRGELITAMESAPISAEDRSQMWAKFHKERKAWSEEREELLKAVAQLETQATVLTAEPIPTVSPANDPALPFNPPTRRAQENNESKLFALDPSQRAMALNLSMAKDVRENGPEPRITFVGRAVRWPWLVPHRGLSGLSSQVATSIAGMSFTENELWLLHQVRSVESFALSWTDERRFELQTAVDQLQEARLLDTNEEEGAGAINTQGRLFLAWLLRVGFEFNDGKPLYKTAA